MVALSRNVHRKQAMEMLLTGETIDASTAREFGLINRIMPRQYLNQIVMKYAEVIASKSPLTLKIGKEAFYRQAEMSLHDAYEYTAAVMVENMMARETPRKASAPSSASASRNGPGSKRPNPSARRNDPLIDRRQVAHYVLDLFLYSLRLGTVSPYPQPDRQGYPMTLAPRITLITLGVR